MRNTRGLNRGSKQHEMQRFIQMNHVALFGLLETKVRIPKMGMLYQNLCPGCCFSTNSSIVDRGRIVIG